MKICNKWIKACKKDLSSNLGTVSQRAELTRRLARAEYWPRSIRWWIADKLLSFASWMAGDYEDANGNDWYWSNVR